MAFGPDCTDVDAPEIRSREEIARLAGVNFQYVDEVLNGNFLRPDVKLIYIMECSNLYDPNYTANIKGHACPLSKYADSTCKSLKPKLDQVEGP